MTDTEDETTEQELAYGGVCPVCGDEFTDGWDGIDEGDSIEDIRLCMVEKDGEEGTALFHLPQDQS